MPTTWDARSRTTRRLCRRFGVNGGHVMGGPVFWNSSTSGPARLQLVGGRRPQGLSPERRTAGDAALRAGTGGVARASRRIADASPPTVSARAPASSGRRCRRARTAFTASLPAYSAPSTRKRSRRSGRASRTPRAIGVGTLMKFVPPVVANGRVYLPNHDGRSPSTGCSRQTSRSASPLASRVIAPGAAGTFSDCRRCTRERSGLRAT